MPEAAHNVTPLRGPEPAERDSAARIRRLERELATVRAELRAAEAALDGAGAEFRSTNDALRRVNDELRVILDHAPVAIVLCAADATVVAANGLAHEWLGLPDSALLGEPYHPHVPEGCRERVRAADEAAIAGGTATTSDVHRLDVPGRPPLWLRTARVPFRHADTGEPMLLLVSEDRTARHEQEVRAEYFRSRLELAIGASGIGLWDRFLDSGEAFWCDRLKTIMGVPSAFEPPPGGFLDRVHPDDADEVARVEAEHLASGLPFSLRARIVRPDGEVRWVARSGRVYERDGAPVRMAGTVVDVTEATLRETRLRDAHDELARSNEELSRFGHVCSHDIKEPVRLVQAMSALLLSDGGDRDPVQDRELLERINASTARLREIIDGLLARSCVETRIECVDVDLAEVAREVRENLGIRIGERGATLELGELPTVRGARVHFVQLIQNLVGNALTHTDGAAPRVRVRAERLDGAVRLTVDDDGPGVPEADRERIFDTFARLEAVPAEGSGLGLSICRRIVHRYGGSIDCGRGELGGAEFRVVLPEPAA